MNASRQQKKMEAKAAAWVIRLGGDPLRDDERRKLAHWLAKDPAHEAAFQYARSSWASTSALKSLTDALSGDAAPAWSKVVAPTRRGAASRRVGRIGLRMAAAAVVLLTLGVLVDWLNDPTMLLAADYRTPPGQSRTVTLADGSIVQLATASALAVDFGKRERRVVLLAGEAYFIVAPMQGKETRPFTVQAANGTARALGTQLMVDLEGGGAEVTVIEHRVQVTATGQSGDAVGTAVLSPGQSVRYDHVSGLGAVTRTDLDQATAWRQGRLIFDNVPLADVVSALNRYRRGPIVLARASLAQRRVSGVFETADLRGALASITRELEVQAVSVPPFVTLLY